MPDKCKALVERCWANSYDDRPDFDAIVVELDDVLKDMPFTPSAAGGKGGCCAVQ